MKVCNQISILEENGTEVDMLPNYNKVLSVESHEKKRGLVILRYDDKNISVPANDLKIAIANASRQE